MLAKSRDSAAELGSPRRPRMTATFDSMEPLLIALQKPLNPFLFALSEQKYASNTQKPSMSEYPSFRAT